MPALFAEFRPKPFGGGVIFIAVLLAGLYFLSWVNYLLFHSLAELFSIVIATGIFIIAWNARSYMDNNYLLFLGIGYFFVGLVDTIHTLSYKGMGVFPGYDANLPTQLWIAARYLESLSLVAAPFFFQRKLKVSPLVLVYSLVVSVLFLSIAYGFFPQCYIEGQGLTTFKRISEYTISVILCFSLFLLRKKKEEFDQRVFLYLNWSIVTTIISEMAFTFYVSVYGFSNFVGHVFKIVSFYLIYKAIIEVGLRKPYDLLWRRMKLGEKVIREERDRIKKYLEIAGVMIIVIGADGQVKLINKKGCEILGYREEEIIGKNWFENFLPERVRDEIKKVFGRIMSGDVAPVSYMENPILTKEGEERLMAWYNTFLRNENGEAYAALSSGEDITERKKWEQEREALIEKLESALGQVKVLKGLLPICASCKKIRNDQGYWVQIESYIREHADVDFSHGLCPECRKKLYGDIDE